MGMNGWGKDIVIKGQGDQMAAGVYLEQKSQMKKSIFFLLTQADQKLQYYNMSVSASTYRSNNRIKTEIAPFCALKKNTYT